MLSRQRFSGWGRVDWIVETTDVCRGLDESVFSGSSAKRYSRPLLGAVWALVERFG